MNESMLSPVEMNELAHEAALKKASYKTKKTFWLAVLGGMYIAFGGLFATIVATGSLGVLPYGLVKVAMGLVFSLGLIAVVLGGAELFTGSTVVTLAALDRKITWLQLVKNWFWVYFGNFVGSILVALMIILSGNYQAGSGAFGKTILIIALSKLHYSFWQALLLGILCNLFVCLAIWLSYSAKQVSGKILAIVFPVTAFIALGFEHSVANMYLVSVGIVLKTFDFAFTSGTDVVNLTWQNFALANLVPVTIGNIIGGATLWLLNRQAYKK